MLLQPVSNHCIPLCSPALLHPRPTRPVTSGTARPQTAGVPLRDHGHPRRKQHIPLDQRGAQGGTHAGAESTSRRLGRIQCEGQRESSLTGGTSTRTRHLASCAPPPRSSTATPLIGIYYLSHAIPRQKNHQQRNPTSPPTTTTAATEMPAMAPVERPVLFALEDAHVFAWLSRV